jgi:hypothetical protein
MKWSVIKRKGLGRGYKVNEWINKRKKWNGRKMIIEKNEKWKNWNIFK